MDIDFSVRKRGVISNTFNFDPLNYFIIFFYLFIFNNVIVVVVWLDTVDLVKRCSWVSGQTLDRKHLFSGAVPPISVSTKNYYQVRSKTILTLTK